MEGLVGQVIASRYRIEEVLGSGAMGVVYRAQHVKLARQFAIKMLHPSLLTNAKLRRRFEREAELAATLRHPNVVGVVDVGETSHGLLYIVMEYADGQPLSAMIGESPLPARRVIEFARHLCDGLQHAHEAGLIHRDFKPDNVIVETDRSGVERLRIVDFGIALLRDDAPNQRERLTTAGVVLGTPHYMAPEHAIGEAVDHRIDLFALGVICFEMLSGKMPFDGDGVDVARANLMFDTPAMGVRVPFLDVDPLLEALTRRLMSRNRDLRPPTAKATRDLLDLIATDRAAAAVALGVELPPALLAPPPMRSKPMLAMPIVTQLRSAPTTLWPGSAAVTRPCSIDDDSPNPASSRKRMIGIATAGSLLLGALGIAALTGRSASPASVAVDQPVEPTPTISNALETVSHDSVAVVATPAEPSPAPKPSPVGPRKQITVKLPGAPLASITSQPSHEATAAEVAEHYALVGRALSNLEHRHGLDATLDLWPRFRHIRINDAISTRDQRLATTRTLVELQHDVATRDKH